MTELSCFILPLIQSFFAIYVPINSIYDVTRNAKPSADLWKEQKSTRAAVGYVVVAQADWSARGLRSTLTDLKGGMQPAKNKVQSYLPQATSPTIP